MTWDVVVILADAVNGACRCVSAPPRITVRLRRRTVWNADSAQKLTR